MYLSSKLFLLLSLCLTLHLLELELLSTCFLQVQPLTKSVFNRHLNQDREQSVLQTYCGKFNSFTSVVRSSDERLTALAKATQLCLLADKY